MSKQKLSSIEATVVKEIDSSKDDIESFLKEIIRTRSVTGKEQDVQQLMARKFEESGLKVDYWVPDYDELMKSNKFSPPGPREPQEYSDWYAGRPNVVGVLRGSKSGNSLLLNCHIDTVPEGNHTMWKHDPFAGEVIGDRIYGRGASDMKGGTVSGFAAISAIAKSGVDFNGSLSLASVIEEEIGGYGTLASLERGHIPDEVIITEPTDREIWGVGNGAVLFQLKIKGKPAHASESKSGVSAIEKMGELIVDLKKCATLRERKVTHPLLKGYDLADWLLLGTLDAGFKYDWAKELNHYQTVAAEARLGGQLRVIVGETSANVINGFLDCVRSFEEKDEWLSKERIEARFFGIVEPMVNDLSHPLFSVLQASVHSITGIKPPIVGFRGSCDGGIYTHHFKIPAIVYGPGSTANGAHSTDEWVSKEEVIECAKSLAVTMIRRNSSN